MTRNVIVYAALAVTYAMALTGCQSSQTPVSGTAQNLKLTLTIKTPPQGALPETVKIVIENISSVPVKFTAPCPLYPEDAIICPNLHPSWPIGDTVFS
jgi:hypothetical protein